MIDPRWTVVSSRVIHEGRPHRLRLDTCRTPRGVEVVDYLVREIHDLAMIFAVDADDRVLLVRQYRHGIGEMSLELPAGLLDHGETVIGAGARELREETGAVATLEKIGELYANPAVQTNRVHVLLGRDAKVVAAAHGDDEEDLDLVLVPRGELGALVTAGDVRSSVSVAAILLTLAHLEREPS